MKKILYILLALTVCGSLSAQNKGDKRASIYLSGDFYSDPHTYVDGWVEFTYFVADRCRVGLFAGVPYSSEVDRHEGQPDVRNSSIGFFFGPNFAYYIKLMDNLYFTPEIGAAFEFDSFKEKIASTTLSTGKINDYYGYIHPIHLEFRLNSKFAVGLGVSSFFFGSKTTRDDSNQILSKENYCGFRLNTGSASFVYYF